MNAYKYLFLVNCFKIKFPKLPFNIVEFRPYLRSQGRSVHETLVGSILGEHGRQVFKYERGDESKQMNANPSSKLKATLRQLADDDINAIVRCFLQNPIDKICADDNCLLKEGKVLLTRY